MRYIDILTAFEMEINKIDDTLNKPLVNDSLYWLNQAVLKFCKIRFSGHYLLNCLLNFSTSISILEGMFPPCLAESIELLYIFVSFAI